MDCFPIHLSNLQEIELLANAAKRALDLRTPEGRTEGNAITRSGLVLLCGYFEGFIRELLEEAVDQLNDNKIDVNRLPGALLYSVVEEHTDAYRKSGKENAPNLIKICKNEISAKLNKSKLAKTGGNPTVDTIEALFQTFGIPEVIDHLSIKDYAVDSTYVMESQVSADMRSQFSAAIEAQIGTQNAGALNDIVDIVERKWLARKKRRTVGYINEINELLKRRNRIAHGEGQEPVTPDDLIEAKDMIQKLTTGLHDLIENRLDNIVANKPAVCA